ncbi:MAG TPA: C45 family peptidase [Tepidisphaeraceae bacterium]|nr:C45 family peptidase [Tepidisphaeraceae bacterium]
MKHFTSISFALAALLLLGTVQAAEKLQAVPAYHGPLVELRGQPVQLGEEQGRDLDTQIQLLHKNYLDVYMGTGARRFVALSAAKLFERHFLPEHLAEVDALAKQTGLDEREAVLAQCFLDLTPMSACSTVTLPSSASPDHIARFGRDLDFPSLNIADKYSTVFIYHPAGKYAFASIGWPGMIGVLSGMNEQGLCLANMEVTRSARLPTAMPYTLLYRTVLERCKTVNEAIALLEKEPRQTANNLMLMDATGDRAVAELTPESVTIRRAPDTEPLVSTNHQRGIDLDSTGRCWRYDCLEAAGKEEFGSIGLTKLESMLAQASPGADTLQSMVFEPANRVIYLSTGANAAKKGHFERLDLKSYFK